MNDPLNQDRKGKWKRRLKKTIVTGAIIFGTYHSIQFNYNRKQIADFFYEPKEFREFEKHTGIKLKGFEEYLGVEETLKIAQILNHEKLAKEQLSGITIESRNYDEKSNIGKILEKMEFHGFANPVTNNITLNESLSKLFLHELAHIKTYSKTSLFSEGEFLEEWEKLQEKSKYKYYSAKEKINYYKSRMQKDTTAIKILELDESKLDSSGYISPYARTDKYEDIAETVENTLYLMYYNSNIIKEIANPILEEKINILVKYDLLPKETKEYIAIKSEYLNWNSLFVKSSSDTTNNLALKTIEKTSRKNYIENSKKFIEQYPESFMYNNIIIDRAVAIYTAYNIKEDRIRTESINSLIEALNHPEKIGYSGVIKELGNITKYTYLKNPEKNPYTIALTEYNKKLNKLDMNLLNEGVTDKLIELKILKE